MQKLWIDLDGNLIPVGDDLAHEEWAIAHGFELEALLDAGWVRVQAVPPPYLLIDFCLPLTAAQSEAIVRLFENRFDQVVIEYRSVARSFKDGDEAMRYVLGRK